MGILLDGKEVNKSMPEILNMHYFITELIEKYSQIIIYNNRLVDYLEQDHGTGGWQAAFEHACQNSGNDDLNEYCGKLQWDEYDRFSSDINHIVLEWLKENTLNH